MTEQALMWLAGCALILWTPAAFAGVLLLGVVYARNLEFVHECLHAIALPRARHNAVAGHLLALPMFVSFERWRAEHMQHHRDVQIEGFRYEYARLTTWREYVLHALMLRHFRDAFSRMARLDRRYRLLTAAILTICALSLVTHSWLPLFLWIMPLPFAAIVHTHIELPEHFGLERIGSRDPLRNSRVIPANSFVTWFVNANNYHAIHHWRPSMPISRLRQAFESLPDRSVETSSYGSFYRSFFSGLALALALIVALALPARADDYGPPPDIRAVRHDLPVILARNGKLVIDDVVVDRDDAIAQWHIGRKTGWDALVRRFGRWWIRGTHCETWLSVPSNAIRALAAQHIPLLMPTPSPSPSPCPKGQPCRGVFHDEAMLLCDPAPQGYFDVRFQSFWQGEDAFELTMKPAANNAQSDAHLESVELRAPTEAESWNSPGGNSYFFFSADLNSPQAVRLQAGTTIDVWFPFALEPSKKYSLTIAHASEPIGPIEGTLEDNTLHFVLPAFSVSPGAHLMGEIDGD